MLYCYISPGMQGAIFYYPLPPPPPIKIINPAPPLPYGLLDLIPHMVSGSNMCSFNSEASPTVNIVRYWCRILTNLQKSDSLHFKKCTALKFNCKNVQKVSNPVPNFLVHQTLT